MYFFSWLFFSTPASINYSTSSCQCYSSAPLSAPSCLLVTTIFYNILILNHWTSMVCLGGLTEGGIGSRGALWLAKGLFLNFCWVRGESCRVTSFLGLATSLVECCDTSFFAFLQFVGGSSTDDDSSDVREGALACLWVLLSETFFFGCIKRNNM